MITSKDLITFVLVLLPLETISMFILKNAVKEKLFKKIRKNEVTHKSATRSKIVSCSKICKKN